MAKYVVSGLVPTSWTGNNNTNLISLGVAHKEASLSIDAPSFDDTAFASGSTFRTMYPGIRNITASMRGRWNPTNVSNSIGLTWSTGYTANLRRISLNIRYGVQKVTSGAGTTVDADEFLPGLYSASGTFEAFVDDTTALPKSGLPTIGSATIKLIEAGTTDHTVAGTIFANRIGPTFQIGEAPVATFAFDFRSAMTWTGVTDGTTGTWFHSPFKYWIDSASGVLGLSTVGTLTLTGTGSRTYAMSAFASGISIDAQIGQEMAVSVDVQGTGDVTIG